MYSCPKCSDATRIDICADVLVQQDHDDPEDFQEQSL